MEQYFRLSTEETCGIVDPAESAPSLNRQGSASRTRSAAPAAIVAICLIAAALWLLTYAMPVPPNVQSDYCYLLLAADRFYEGQGLTSLQPMQPNQPWEWQYDWGFLTNWPPGYSILVAGVRWITGWATLEASRAIGIVACAAALVGWFLCLRRCLPRGITGVLLACVGATLGLQVDDLVSPSTDLLLVAAIPFVLLLVSGATARAHRIEPGRSDRRWWLLATAGGLAGALFWIRHASVFLPLSIGAYLLLRQLIRRDVSWRAIAAFALVAAAPIVTLIAIDRSLGVGESLQAQYNLGQTVGVYASPDLLTEAWKSYTNLGYYDHHAWLRSVFALWPLIAIVAMIALALRRRRMGGLAYGSGAAQAGEGAQVNASLLLNSAILLGLLGMLVMSTVLFHDRFHFTTLERYYLPVRPLYIALFCGPLVMLLPRVRLPVVLMTLVALSWTVQHDWTRTYRRWGEAERATTPYGRWGNCFAPGESELLAWLKENVGADDVILSNFHEFLALETSLPILPLAGNRAQLERWVERIAAERQLNGPRVLFVLHPDNKWRDYFLPDFWEVVEAFDLRAPIAIPAGASARIFQYEPEFEEEGT